MDLASFLLKWRKKLKTLITVPSHNFTSLTTLINSADELELAGSDGNNVPFAQTLHSGASTIVFFDTETRNFVSVVINGEIPSTYQLVHVIRDVA